MLELAPGPKSVAAGSLCERETRMGCGFDSRPTTSYLWGCPGHLPLPCQPLSCKRGEEEPPQGHCEVLVSMRSLTFGLLKTLIVAVINAALGCMTLGKFHLLSGLWFPHL